MKRKVWIFALVLVLLLSLCACGQNFKSAEAQYDMEFDESGATYSRNAKSASFGAAPMEMPTAEESAAADAAETPALAGAEEGVNIPAPMPEKIIYTVNLSMETTQFEQTVSSFEAAVKSFGGYTQYSDVSGTTDYTADGASRLINRYASYTVCIPADKLDAFLAETTVLGNVTSNNKSAENVTTRYADYETRKNSLLTEETRLLELLGKAENVENLIALEERLAQVRYEIESIQSNLNDLDRRLAYSTVCLYLQEVRGYRNTAPVTQSFGERMHDAFGNGWDNFVEGLEDFAVGMAEAIIPLAIFVVIVVIVIVIVRKKVKKSRAKKAAEKPAGSSEAPAEPAKSSEAPAEPAKE